MPIQKVIFGNKAPIKIWTTDIEEQAEIQLNNLSTLPFIYHHIAVMPDVHYGKGSTVGSVIATQGAIIPAAVGVDLSCGVLAQKLNLLRSDLPEDLVSLRQNIEDEVPHGINDTFRGDKGSWKTIPGYALVPWYEELEDSYRVLNISCKINPLNQLGTLGGGNHFIELATDETNHVWILIHTGSRAVGNAIGTYYIDLAKQNMKRWFISLPNQDLAYIPEDSDLFFDYINATNWASKYAEWNRKIILRTVLRVLDNPEKETLIDCVHNYCSKENHYNNNVWITRKGAVRARLNDTAIIPGSMGGYSYVVKGLGNHQSFNSCAHGAGRKLSRSEAKRTFTLNDLNDATQGIECKKDSSVLDEIPLAYKSIKSVMENQADLCSVVHTLKGFLTVKG